MTRRWLVASLLALASAGCDGSGNLGPPAAAAIRPNVIFILFDDLHYDDLGSYGASSIQTPHLDRLAAEGMRFTDFTVGGPVCSPTRAALLTGRYPHRFNFKFVTRYVGYPDSSGRPVLGSNRGIPQDVTTLPEHLAARGYRTFHLGKWHLGRRRVEQTPTRQGFEHSVVAGSGPESVHRDNNLFYDEELVRSDGGNRRLERAEGFLTDVLTDRALTFLQEASGQSFFLNLWTVAPHTPLVALPRWAARYPDDSRGRLAAMVSHLDEAVGRIVEEVDRLGLGESTLILVASDNGGLEGLHPDSRWRGGKATLYEGGLRVPLIARWTGHIPAGTVSDQSVTSMDILPTLVELAGGQPDSLESDGRSFAEILLGSKESQPSRTLFWEHGGYEDPENPKALVDDCAIRRDDWKLVRYKGEWALFDLASDPGEQTDLFQLRPDMVGRLREEYQRWRLHDRRMVPPIRSAGPEVVLDHLDDRGLSMTFRDPGGSARLDAADEVYDVHDGDFSLDLKVRLDAEGGNDGVTIAQRPGSWRLGLDRDRRPFVEIRGDGGGDVVLRSATSLVPRRWHQLTFVVHGHMKKNATARLYVDGALEDEDATLLALAVGGAGFFLGGPEDGSQARFLGSIRDLATYLLPLDEQEVAILHHQKGPER